ncbi:glutathione S-transferase A-like [Lethenteron reissneri]|uniref:glutathione S-transferase A-like n=1 Tax=Lethenteron reissneri TaxID=7753 RepID=UPI002AB70C3C|nr:glutathione S-transferase A-like [Lethenteron reissneri]
MASDMIVYWGSGSPPCWRILLCLEEKALQGYQQKLLSMEKQEHKSAAVIEINPRGQLPAFRHGEHVINESLGAVLYLENQFKAQGTKLMPEAAAEQAVVLQRMFEVPTLHQKSVIVIMYTWIVPEAERHESAVTRNKQALGEELKLWEGYLAKVCSRIPIEIRGWNTHYNLYLTYECHFLSVCASVCLSICLCGRKLRRIWLANRGVYV